MRKFLMVLSGVVLVAGCQGDGGSEFVGEWVAGKDGCSTLQVVENGKNYLANIETPDIFYGGTSKISAPAVVSNGTLTIQASMPIIMTIDQASGELVSGEARYRRPDGSEKCTARSGRR